MRTLLFLTAQHTCWPADKSLTLHSVTLAQLAGSRCARWKEWDIASALLSRDEWRAVVCVWTPLIALLDFSAELVLLFAQQSCDWYYHPGFSLLPSRLWSRAFCAVLDFPPVFVGRYAHPGDSPLRHASNAGQCAGTVLLCLLHLRHCWGAAVGWAITEPMLHGRRRQNVSCYSNRQMSLHPAKVPSAPISFAVSAIILKKWSISAMAQALLFPDQDHI